MSYTCITCHVVFITPESQRDHYKSEWHRYNMKRKVAELSPVTKEQFQIKESLQKQNQEESKESFSGYCKICRKYFSSRNAQLAHLNSKKHQTIEAKFNQNQNSKKSQSDNLIVQNMSKPINSSQQISELDEVMEDDGDDEWESCEEDDITINDCIFCSYESENLENSVKHMTTIHSFFIPDLEYVVDLAGLILYLYNKVTTDFVCIWCCKAFSNVKSVQQHMLDVGHCKMLHEGESLLEYADFYDYTSSYPEETGRENVEEVTIENVTDDTWELTLPSGAKIGHRSLALYYRQNLPPTKQDNTKKLLHKVMSHYRAIGWTGTAHEMAVLKAKDISHFRKLQAKQTLKLGVRNNKLQHHFRPQVLF